MAKKKEITQKEIEEFMDVLKKRKTSDKVPAVFVEDHRFEDVKDLGRSNLVKVVDEDISHLFDEDLIKEQLSSDSRREKKDEDKDYPKGDIYKHDINGAYSTKKDKNYGAEINKDDYEAISYEQRDRDEDEIRR